MCTAGSKQPEQGKTAEVISLLAAPLPGTWSLPEQSCSRELQCDSSHQSQRKHLQVWRGFR